MRNLAVVLTDIEYVGFLHKYWLVVVLNMAHLIWCKVREKQKTNTRRCVYCLGGLSDDDDDEYLCSACVRYAREN